MSQNSSRTTILLGGDLTATPRLRAQVAGTLVIAADSGISHASRLGLKPDLWVGDFDSATDDHHAEHAAVPMTRFPAEKDKTDGEIAIVAARKAGATEIILAGAFGGERADHAFLHLTTAMRAAESGLKVLLSSGTTEAVPLLPGEAAFDYPPGTVFSVLGFDDLTGLTLSGVKWPLERRHVPFGSSLTISNEVASRLVASLEAGRAMVVANLPNDAQA
jgi:thiamine pyrophosphokinase